MQNNFTKQQLAAISQLDRDLILTAGAGAGKTRVLVERFLHILQNTKLKASDILAITFTQKAGYEMIERIRSGILQKIQDTHNTFWQEKLQELPAAHIGTIHSLYSKILRSHPVEAELEPSFTLLTPITAAYLRQDFTEDYLRNLFAKKNSVLIDIYKVYDYKSICDILQFVTDKSVFLPADRQAFDEMLAANTAYPALQDSLSELYRQFCEMISEDNLAKLRKKKTITAATILEIASLREPFASDSSLEGFLAWYDKVEELCSSLTKRAESKDFKEALQALQKNLEYYHTACAIQAILPQLQELLFNYLAAWRTYKLQCNYLTFDDLELYTVRLLREHPSVRSHWQNKYHYIMVDEFQDINHLQKEFISLLIGQSGNLFVVGDEKQSIYAFRGADINIFTQAHTELTADAEQIMLPDNFRSNAGIINFCNNLFVNMDKVQQGNITFAEITAAKSGSADAVQALFLPKDSDSSQELQLVAQELIRQVQNGFNWADIAILVRQKNDITPITQVLSAYSIPYNVLDKPGFWEDRCIVDAINLLSVLSNTDNQLGLYGVLRSPLFALSDKTLTILGSTYASLWQAIEMDIQEHEIEPTQMQLFSRAGRILRELKRQASFLPLTTLFDEMLSICMLPAIAIMQEEGLQNLANLQRLAEIIREFEKEHSAYISDFITYIESLRLAEQQENMPNVPDYSQNAVQIMTIHKSKGLEFPIVCLPNLSKLRPGGGGHKLMNFAVAQGLGLKIFSEQQNKYCPSYFFDKIGQESKFLELQECKRIFYVALTRAKEKLLLSGIETTSADNALYWITTYADSNLYNLIEPNCDDSILSAVPSDNEPDFTGLGVALENIRPIGGYDTFCLDRLSVTAVSDYQNCPYYFYYKHIEKMPELPIVSKIGGESKYAAIIGQFVHTLLEKCLAPSELSAQLLPPQMFLPHNILSRLQDNAIQMTADYMSSHTYKSIADKIIHKEFYFNFYPTEILSLCFTGIVDCIVLNDDKSIGIIDYKTGKLNSEELALYSKQLSLYAKAMEYIFKKQVSYAAIHHIPTTGEYIISKEQLCESYNELVTLAEEILQVVLQNNYTANNTYCDYCNYDFFCPLKSNKI